MTGRIDTFGLTFVVIRSAAGTRVRVDIRNLKVDSVADVPVDGDKVRFKAGGPDLRNAVFTVDDVHGWDTTEDAFGREFLGLTTVRNGRKVHRLGYVKDLEKI
jgi:hypothetical protein